MGFTNEAAVDFAFLAMYAEDMYDEPHHSRRDDPRVAVDGWKIAAYLQAKDIIHHRMQLNEMAAPVYFGYLANNVTNPNEWVVAIRGTDGLAEWIIDADFLSIKNPWHPGTRVERGFWGIYATMILVDLAGKPIEPPAATPQTGPRAAAAIAKVVGQGTVTVTGHSLGGAIATYLTLDVALARPGRATKAVLFASPQAGDAALMTLFQVAVPDYQVINYVLDVVPRVPFGPDYATLPKTRVLQPDTADAGVRVGLDDDHHVICYAAMIDYLLTKTKYNAGIAQSSDPAGDKKCWASVLGDKTTVTQIARDLADVLNHIDWDNPAALHVMKVIARILEHIDGKWSAAATATTGLVLKTLKAIDLSGPQADAKLQQIEDGLRGGGLLEKVKEEWDKLKAFVARA
jgi:hypothetical protein